jgi:hypothetical protein
VASGACRELAHVVLALAEDRRDLRIPIVEYVVQEQRGALLGRETLQHHQHRKRHRVGRLGVPRRIVAAIGDNRFGQPLADVALAAGTRRTELVDRQPRGHRGYERPRRCDLLAGLQRLTHPQQRLLHHVLGLGDAAEHPVGERERGGAQLSEELLTGTHSAHPSRAVSS